MKHYLSLLMVFLMIGIHAQSTEPEPETTTLDSTQINEVMLYLAMADSLNGTLNYEKGEITIGDNLAKLDISENFKFLNPEETDKVLVDAWGNPPAPTLGMIIPDSVNPFGFDGWGVVITYEEDGYVKDEDAADIDFNEMLKQMQDDIIAANPDRENQGYGAYFLEDWAEQPHYDADEHKLYWALNLKFGEESNTLNYNVRILGRRGVLVLNAVSTMDQLTDVKGSMQQVMPLVAFNEGNKYSDFNPEVDKVAAYGIGALIAGKIAAKAGFFKVIGLFLAKGWKIIALVLVGIGTFLKKVFGKPKDQRDIAA